MCVDVSLYACYCETSTRDGDFGATGQKCQGEECSDVPRVFECDKYPITGERKGSSKGIVK